MKDLTADENTGFQFECQRCGSCCDRRTSGHTYIEMEEVLGIRQKLGISFEDLLIKYVECREEIVKMGKEEVQFKIFSIKQENGACVFLRGKACSIYEVRPFQCRSFPFWSEILNNKRLYKKIEKSCLGIGKGKKFSHEEIQQKLKEDDQFHVKLYENSNFLKSIGIEKLTAEVQKNIEKEGFMIEESALELIKREILRDILSYYSQKSEHIFKAQNNQTKG